MFKKQIIALMSGALLMGSFSSTLFAAEPASIASGAEIYKTRCSQCHGDSGEGNGQLVEYLKLKPADLTTLNKDGCVTKKVLRAVLGKHRPGMDSNKMPLLKEVLSLEKVYDISQYIESIQK